MILLVCLTAISSLFLQNDMAQACTKWNVRVKTAHDAGDGTDNNVFMEVNGDPKSKTELNRDNLKTKNLLDALGAIDKFEASDVDDFRVCLDHDDIRTVRLSLDQNGNRNDAWRILAFEMRSGDKIRNFACRCIVRVVRPLLLRNPSSGPVQ
ncbi:uncharacterized protein LOC142350924 [Convolutriloba macropyga]|uniref:uncharacterized protein LOC142350924 n=1 Tax=Convolutriloba macropyga TaxID=536237 RepID=UPI003F5204C7